MAEFTVPLDLPDVNILKVEIDGDVKLTLSIQSSLPTTKCQRCGREISRFHGYGDWIVLRHLPILGREVYIRYRAKRFECRYCEGHPTTTQHVVWHTPNSPYTRAYEDHILKTLINSTVQDVSLKEHIGYDGILGIVERRVASSVDWSRYRDLSVLGLDEIALRKGHGDFVVIVSSRLSTGQVVVLAVLPDREKATVQAFLETIPAALKATIHSVCTDMYEGYRQAVEAVLAQAQVVVDRFHVAQAYREAADRVRKDEMRRLKKQLTKAEYATLKPCRHAFWKNEGDLNPQERQSLERLFAYAPTLRLVHMFREGLRAIFERPLSKAQAQVELKAWMFLVREQHIDCFVPFLKTLTNFFEEITNFFVHRLTSGFVEGLNNKIKVLKRRAFGITNLTHLFQRLFLDLEGYQLFA